jgi:hypothetical protein
MMRVFLLIASVAGIGLMQSADSSATPAKAGKTGGSREIFGYTRCIRRDGTGWLCRQ